MKILSLKALNINSLKGETKIDFAELTKGSSLFAITGATGSGKSTILDIISCALYGRTARLKNPNDLMSRHAGEAYCEVEFEIKGERYRSSWSQKRARKKHDGKFQTAKMELVNLQTDTILPIKSREVPKKVEELSGLDFGRFTQSMLLAQGGFDAFLKADEKERSALLEKITGTQIYADISVAIFEKHRELSQEIESQRRVLDSIELLDDATLQERETLLKHNTLEKQKSDKALQVVQESLHWLGKVQTLKEASKRSQEALKEATERKKEFEDSFTTLALANKALNVTTHFNSYSELQKSLIQERESLFTLKSELESLDGELHTKRESYGKVSQEFESLSKSFESETQKLQKSREILNEEKQIQRSLIKAKNLLKSEELEKIMLSLEMPTQESDIVEEKIEYGVLEERVKLYNEAKESVVDSEKALSASTQLLQERELLLKPLQELLKELSLKLQEREEVYKKLQTESLNERSISELTLQELQKIELLQRELKRFKECQLKKEKQKSELKKQRDLLNSFIQTKEASQEHKKALQSHIETLREKLLQERLLKKYEDDRKNLVEGEPCLLCGATKHPYAKLSNALKESMSEEQLERGTQELEELEEKLKSLESHISVSKTKQESVEIELQRVSLEVEELKSLFLEYNFELSDASERLLQEKEKNLREKLQKIEQNRLQRDEVLKERDTLQSSYLEKERDSYALQATLERVRSEKESLSTQLKIQTQKQNILFLELERGFRELSLKLDTLHKERISILNVADLESYEQEIHKEYKKAQREEQELKMLLEKLSVKREERERYKKSLVLKLKEDEKSLDSLAKELDALLEKNGFEDVDALESASMSSDAREELATLCKEVSEEYERAEAVQLQTDKQLLECEDEALTKRDKEELETLQSLLKQKLDALQESVGSLKTELELNQNNSKKQQEKIASLKAQEERLRVWVKLNELVGSADGTKFKKYAQGITLEHLINLANQHLKILSSRYTLTRNQEKLLELEVVDAYQGNVIRGVATLSGGESFIVSLALALGLSELASQKISIDSLFLDEGFGTLDAQSLEIALNALNLLQSGGKMIGIISHVEALKERIPLQIRVIPKGDGSSVVEVES